MCKNLPGVLIMSIGTALCIALCHAGDAPVTSPTTASASAASAPSGAGDLPDDPAGLSRRIPELQLDAVPLDEAFRTLSEKTRANISIRWEGLTDAGVPRATPVKLHLWDVNLGQALTILLTAVCPPATDGDGQATPRLGYTVTDNVVTVSTVGASNRMTPTVVYNVRDLIEMHIAGSNDTAPDPQRVQASLTHTEAAEALGRNLMEGIAPDSWRQNGGALGSYGYFGGLLVIRQTPENHREIAALLQKLRDADKKIPWSTPAATQPVAQPGTPAAGQ
ncbi:MAG: pilQ 2 [Phycisphaerales bacterium]|nr:pilQ 2 [Phycisphaerales bacterium]